MATRLVDAHVHFWDPTVLSYPWLEGIPQLERTFGPTEYAAATRDAEIDKVVFIECNCRPGQNLDEVTYVNTLSRLDARISGIVAFVDLTDGFRRNQQLDALSAVPLVRGVRQNIQGETAGFALQPEFGAGVRAAGKRGFSFDLCITHDQLGEAIELVRQCPATRFILDHCAKPSIREGLLDPWRRQLAELAKFDNVVCKLSGLLTEADPESWAARQLLPYAQHVIDTFGPDRLLYGSDWPVMTLAGTYCDWLKFARALTEGWSESEQQRFFHSNAVEAYGL